MNWEAVAFYLITVPLVLAGGAFLVSGGAGVPLALLLWGVAFLVYLARSLLEEVRALADRVVLYGGALLEQQRREAEDGEEVRVR